LRSTDRILIGTEWKKTAAKHFGQKGVIDKVGPRGPRMKLVGLPTDARHGSNTGGQPRYQRLDWFELGNTWEPDNRRALHQWDLWKSASILESSAEEKELLNSQIESDNTIMTPELPQALVECVSVYHSHKNKQVDTSVAYMTRNGRWWCLECKEKSRQYAANAKAKQEVEATRLGRKLDRARARQEKQLVVVEEYQAPEPLVIEPVEVLPAWKITVVEPTVHVVRARDFLEAAAQVSEKGEIIRVEKI